MSRNPTVSARDVEKAYTEVQALLPNIRPLIRDDFFKSWDIGNIQIGRTCRDAVQYLHGLRDGLRVAVFSAGLAGAA